MKDDSRPWAAVAGYKRGQPGLSGMYLSESGFVSLRKIVLMRQIELLIQKIKNKHCE